LGGGGGVRPGGGFGGGGGGGWGGGRLARDAQPGKRGKRGSASRGLCRSETLEETLGRRVADRWGHASFLEVVTGGTPPAERWRYFWLQEAEAWPLRFVHRGKRGPVLARLYQSGSAYNGCWAAEMGRAVTFALLLRYLKEASVWAPACLEVLA
jgi:hypothetical protein